MSGRQRLGLGDQAARYDDRAVAGGVMLDWSRVRSGESFQELLNALLGFDDGAARLFNRPGKDGGQDAMSSDGLTIYQAKFHAEPADSTVISDAKAEATSITKHLAPGSKTAPRWSGVKRWVMATNVSGSPALRLRWDNEVKPLFKTLGLEAGLWTTAELEARLTKHPAVREQFFEGGTRLFTTLAEHTDARQRRTLTLFVPWGSGQFRARESEMQAIQAFLQGTKAVMLVHGAGGVGKTRLVVEAAYEALAGSRVEQALVAQNEGLAASTNWYSNVVAETKTLLIVDEPTDASLVARLLEEASAGRAKSWKILVTARSPKEAVIDALAAESELVAVPLSLAPLTPAAARLVAAELLRASVPDELRLDIARGAEVIADFCGGFPIWIDAAIGLIATGKDLGDALRAKDFDRLRKLYLAELLGASPSDPLRSVLRWLALLQPIPRPTLYAMLGNHAGVDEGVAERALDSLVASGLVRAFGRDKRMVEVIPDVFRDLTLREWLARSEDDGPSVEGKAAVRSIVQAIRVSRIPAHTVEATALRSLARIELVAGIGGLMAAAMDAMAEQIRAAKTALDLRGAAQMASSIAPFHGAAFAKLSDLLRTQHVESSPDQGFHADQTLTRGDVLREVAWPLFNSRASVSTDDDFALVAEELRRIYEATREGGLRFRNDGKDPEQLWGRLLSETHTDGAVRVVGRESRAAISRLERGAPERLGDDTLIGLTLSRRRSLFREHKGTATIGWVHVSVDSPVDKLRLALKNDLFRLMGAALPPTHRRRILRLLDKAHREARGEGDSPRTAEITDDLAQVRKLLEAVPPPSLEDAQLMRAIWDWDLEYETDEAIKAAAERCEDAYLRLPGARELLELFSEWHGDDVERAHNDAAARLTEKTPDEIGRWFEDVSRSLGERDESTRLGSIAVRLGHSESTSARAFALDQLASAEGDRLRFFVAMRIIVGMGEALRKRDTAAYVALHEDMVRAARRGPDGRIVKALEQFHGGLRANLGAADLALLEADLPLLHEVPLATLAALGLRFFVDRLRVRTLVEAVLRDCSPEFVGAGVSVFLEHLHLAVSVRKTETLGPEDVGWVASLLHYVDDLDDDLDNGAAYHFTALTKGAPISWEQFSNLVAARLEKNESSAVPRMFPLDVVAPRPTGGPEPEREQVLEALLMKLDEHPKAFFDLPEMIVKLDAGTGALAAVLERKVAGLSQPTFEALEDVATFGGLLVNERPDASGESLGTGPKDPRWRRIARAVCLAATALPEREQRIVFHRLTSQRMRSYSGGLVHDAMTRLGHAREAADAEDDDVLKPLWRWRIDYVEAELARAREEEEEHDT